MPPRHNPRTLAEYPWVIVRIACSFCQRKKAFSLARLAARYGPEQDLAGLLRDVAHTCPYYNENARKYEPRCGAGFVDLERNFPPPDHPEEPVYRQRQPAREDISKPKDAASGQGSPMLSTWSGAEVGYQCRGCPRRATFAKAGLLHVHGDKPVSVVLDLLTADCPRRKSTQRVELCGAVLIRPHGG